ncbi:MAG: acetyl xylan esterase, partial [Lachnospiraceae bacterium]|nr:acetyl xylan esterase [Lachnospiraceae bacterium]
FYKINGKYYLFFIHSLKERWRRVEACFVSDSIEGEFVGGDVLNDDRGYCDQGVAQGGIVDAPDGRWYAILFQDSGAVGRIPVLLPICFEKDYPVFGVDGRVPEDFETLDSRPGYEYVPLTGSDDFRVNADNCGLAEDAGRLYGCFGLKSCWQFNHEPDLCLTQMDTHKGTWSVTTDKVCTNVTRAKNTLTQRMIYPGCSGMVTVDGCRMKIGDYAGISAFQGCYGLIALTREEDGYYVVMRGKSPEDVSLQAKAGTDYLGQECGRVFLGNRANVRLKVSVDFTNMNDEAHFYYQDGEDWIPLGAARKLAFKMDHFTGCRFGLFVYATKEIGGTGTFADFCYEEIK